MLGHVEHALAERHAVEARLRAFAADASHELRTPTAAIRAHAELAQRHPGEVPEPVSRSLARIEAEARRMGSLVEDLLLLARLDAGRPLAREQVDLTRVALDAVQDARAAAPGHRWRLVLPAEPTMVIGDQHRLMQAVANLLANARTHTPEGTEVTLRLDGGKPQDPDGSQDVPDADTDGAAEAGLDAETGVPRPDAPGVVRLSVTDTGPGLDPALAARAFDRFVRGDPARSRASGSTGLGLAITHAIAEAHGGRVRLENHPGHTVFTIELPSL
jgi:two-component system OmpR family sensor kinase